MKLLPGIALMVCLSCVSQPSPWRPDGVSRLEDSATADGSGDNRAHLTSDVDTTIPPTDVTADGAPELLSDQDLAKGGDSSADIGTDAEVESSYPAWEYIHEDHGRASLSAVIEAYNGDVLAAGYQGFGGGGKDDLGLLIRLDGETGGQQWSTAHEENVHLHFTGLVENPVGEIFLSSINAGVLNATFSGQINVVEGQPKDLKALFWEQVSFASSGDLLLSGYDKQSASDGDNGGRICRTSQAGTVSWCKTLGPSGPQASERFACTLELPSGDLVALGSDSPQSGGTEGWAVGLTKDGEEVWEEWCGGPENELETIYDAILTSDGGIVAVGQSSATVGEYEQYDIWLVKLDYEGKELWSKSFDEPELQSGQAVLERPDGTLLVAAHSRGPDEERFGRLLHLTSEGALLHTLDIKAGKQLYVYDATFAADGGIILAGRYNTTTDMDNNRPWVKKMAWPW